jgi:hypothetical protein
MLTNVFSCHLEDIGVRHVHRHDFKLLPRDEGMSRDAELSDRAVTLETIARLFARFRPNMFNCLLFLNSVRSSPVFDARKTSLRTLAV